MNSNNIREWYVNQYPTDELGENLNPSATFTGLFDELDRGKDVYDYFGVGDSLIRERVFERLAWFMGVPYDYIYEQWVSYGSYSHFVSIEEADEDFLSSIK